jgi:hypothetical protein
MHNETQNQVENLPSATNIEQNTFATMTSNRLKKTPLTMNEDCLDNRLPETGTLGNTVIYRKGQTTKKCFKLFHQNIRGLRSKTS